MGQRGSEQSTASRFGYDEVARRSRCCGVVTAVSSAVCSARTSWEAEHGGAGLVRHSRSSAVRRRGQWCWGGPAPRCGHRGGGFLWSAWHGRPMRRWSGVEQRGPGDVAVVVGCGGEAEVGRGRRMVATL